ncbi:MAG: hypothetical protein R6V04_12520, partial [bacterium]
IRLRLRSRYRFRGCNSDLQVIPFPCHSRMLLSGIHPATIPLDSRFRGNDVIGESLKTPGVCFSRPRVFYFFAESKSGLIFFLISEQGLTI